MTQESHVFDSSVAENLRIARPAATECELTAALGAARLPVDLKTVVGEHGARLSGGERQRLALARMLLADFDILILDEPTEHLDEPTARALLRALYAATAGRTFLLLIHTTPSTPLCESIDQNRGPETVDGLTKTPEADDDPVPPGGAHLLHRSKPGRR